LQRADFKRSEASSHDVVRIKGEHGFVDFWCGNRHITDPQKVQGLKVHQLLIQGGISCDDVPALLVSQIVLGVQVTGLPHGFVAIDHRHMEPQLSL
jgi:hypothetical protein